MESVEKRKLKFILKASIVHHNKYCYDKIDYINANTKVCIMCPEHGEFWQTPHNHLNKKGCPICAKRKFGAYHKDNTESFIAKAKAVHGDKYDYSKVEYVNALTKVTIICPEHGPFEQTPHHHLEGHGCKKCANKITGNNGSIIIESKGEKIVEQILLDNLIKYVKQYEIEIDNTINITGKTYIDFYLPKHHIFIEYNGIQHYVPVEHFGGELRYNTYLIPRDNYVKQYCSSLDIKLLEISYKYKDYESILTFMKNNAANIFIK